MREMITLRVIACSGKSVSLDFRLKDPGSQVFEDCQRKFRFPRYQHFGIQLPSGSWLVREKTIEKQLKREIESRNERQFQVHLRIRFWPVKPEKVPEIEFQEILYLQIKEGRIVTDRCKL